MKKLLLLGLAAALLLSVVPVFATPTDQLNDLARYFPAETPVFVASRIDDAYFSTLDGIVDRVRTALPMADIPPHDHRTGAGYGAGRTEQRPHISG